MRLDEEARAVVPARNGVGTVDTGERDQRIARVRSVSDDWGTEEILGRFVHHVGSIRATRRAA